MNVITFDTHDFIKRLEKARFSEDQAEALADAFKQAQSEHETRLATKSDIICLESKFHLLQWMIGFNLAFTMALVWKIFS